MRQAARQFRVVVVTGPRQTGKTSLVRTVFEKSGYSYVSFDDPGLAEAAESRPDDFFRLHPPPICIDEIQYAPGLTRHIKRFVDEDNEARGQFILTGSQPFQLLDSTAESLAGRAAIFRLLGLSAREWIGSEASEGQTPWDFIWRGGLPELWAPAEPISRDRMYANYIRTYLERDVRRMLRVGNLKDFNRLMRVFASRIGQTLNISDAARDIGVSTTTANDWAGVLVESGVILLLEPFYSSLGKRIAKRPKLYFLDSGLAAFLNNFQSPAALSSSNMAGAFWENHVVNQWVRRKEWDDQPLGLYFWRDQSGNEVDLLLEKDGKLHLVECKLTQNPGKADVRGIRKCQSFFGIDRIGLSYVACNTSTPYDIETGVTAINGFLNWELPSENQVNE